MAFAVGVDLGGTKMSAGVVDHQGQLVGGMVHRPTGANRPAGQIVSDLAGLAEEAVQAAGLALEELAGIGIGAPGPLDLAQGVVLTPPNMPSLHHFPLVEEVQRRLRKPVRLNNDGNCFALGEALHGAGQGAGIVCGVTLGTGFGGGIVIGGKVFNGATGTAAELWLCHYKDARFEEYGSSRGVAAAYRRITGTEVAPAEVFARAQQGEAAALRAWEEYGADLGSMLSYVVNTLDPDVVIVGGSVSEGWDFFHRRLDEELRRHINPMPAQHVAVRRAALGSVAGIVGAAALVWQDQEVVG
ncbi:MAG: ROK family protein [bacterium]|jgi:glucokinase|nr:ROK family protein [candidate division KSB1 bacterium]MDH7560154.1 ROK family protein [bacterium]